MVVRHSRTPELQTCWRTSSPYRKWLSSDIVRRPDIISRVGSRTVADDAQAMSPSARDRAVPWERLSALIAEQMGLHFPLERVADLQRGLAGAAEDLGFRDLAAGVDWLMATPLTKPQLQVLASHLTVGETYFFRDPNTFEALASRVLPALIHARNRLQSLRRSRPRSRPFPLKPSRRHLRETAKLMSEVTVVRRWARARLTPAPASAPRPNELKGAAV